MNLRGIKIIDLQHSVLDNSAVEKLEAEIEHFRKKLEETRKMKIDRREKDFEKKESDRDEKLLNFGTAIEELTKTLNKERDAIRAEQRQGTYRFKKKSYVNYRDAGRRPPWKFMWCWYSDVDNYGMYRDWQVDFGSTAVVFGKDRYVPQGVPVNGEGHYVYKDVILMKEDLQKYLRRMIVAKLKGEKASKAEFDALDSQFAAEGANISTEYMEELLSDSGR
jgi:hypothetical protein